MKVRLATARLALAEYQADDLPRLTALLGDSITMAHWPAPLDEAASCAWFERACAPYTEPGLGRFGVWLGPQYIGDAGILRIEVNGRVENDLGYIVDRAHWGHGYGVEVARALLEAGHRCGLTRIVANIAVGNTASMRVAEKIGMRLEARFFNVRNRNFETAVYVSEA